MYLSLSDQILSVFYAEGNTDIYVPELLYYFFFL